MPSKPFSASHGRFRLGPAIVILLGLLFVGDLPLAAEAHEDFVNASMLVSPSEASPGDLVTFWLHVAPHDDLGRLVIAEILPLGLSLASTSAPASCVEDNITWACDVEDERPFSIEVVVRVDPGTEGQDLVNEARIARWTAEEGRRPLVIVSAGVHIIPRATPSPDLHVHISATQDVVTPGGELNYRISVSNTGTGAAANVSVFASMPIGMNLVSASPAPAAGQGTVRWTLDSLPVQSLQFLFNTTLDASFAMSYVQVDVSVTYGDGEGQETRVQGLPSSVEVVSAPSAAPGGIPASMILAALAFVGGGLFVIQHTVGLPLAGRSGAQEMFLLHRSGLVLKHFSAHPSSGTDSDIVGGMMAAVRMFVEDSVSPSAGSLREIRFSGGNVVFVNGENVTLAAVNPRGARPRFAIRATRFLHAFERTNGVALTNFSGDAARLEGIDSLFRKFAGKPRAPGPPTASEEGDVPRQ